jgi:hypothetical protein
MEATAVPTQLAALYAGRTTETVGLTGAYE